MEQGSTSSLALLVLGDEVRAGRSREKRGELTMAGRDLLFDDTYIGPRWRYGLMYRPLVTGGGAPDDWIVYSDRSSTDPRFKRFGTVDYPRQLEAEEVGAFQLIPLGKVR